MMMKLEFPGERRRNVEGSKWPYLRLTESIERDLQKQEGFWISRVDDVMSQSKQWIGMTSEVIQGDSQIGGGGF
jgi:hypothetical protein